MGVNRSTLSESLSAVLLLIVYDLELQHPLALGVVGLYFLGVSGLGHAGSTAGIRQNGRIAVDRHRNVPLGEPWWVALTVTVPAGMTAGCGLSSTSFGDVRLQ